MMRFIITALLYLGFGTIAFAQDHTPLFNKISKMANEGNIEASFHLGMLYTNGIGTETNIAEGVKWLEKAHNNNEAMASYELGRYYEGQVDETVEVNVEKSFRSKMTAAYMGHSLAQFEIGMMYLNFRNATQAEKFLIKAAKQGSVLAYQTLALLYYRGDMTPLDLKQARTFLLLTAKGVEAETAKQFQSVIDQLNAQLNENDILLSDEAYANWLIKKTPITINMEKGLDRPYEIADLPYPTE